MHLKTRLSQAAMCLMLALGTSSVASVPTTVGPPVVPTEAAVVSRPSAESLVVAARAAGPYKGFDTEHYPGDSVMSVWHTSGDYDWVGYYLPAPCHRDTSWSGTRATLDSMGWGTAVIYVGQQTWGHLPRRSSALGSPSSCRANLVNGVRGTLDATDAIARADSEGFPRGTMIFLDLEHMDHVPQAMRDYYRAWTAGMLTDGRYRPGFYAHTRNAADIFEDVKEVFARFGETTMPSFWIAGGSNFSDDKLPAQVGHEFAEAWQGMLDIVQAQGGVSLPIDVSVGALPSPSSYQFAVE
jgi:glycoside hydrolase-like protein